MHFHATDPRKPPVGIVLETGSSAAPDGMTRKRLATFRRMAPLAPAAFIVSGCALRGAPAFVLFGSYFPAWMFCALIGIFGAIGARMIFIVSGLAQVLPWQLFVCAAVGGCCGLAAWLLWFGQ